MSRFLIPLLAAVLFIGCNKAGSADQGGSPDTPTAPIAPTIPTGPTNASIPTNPTTSPNVADGGGGTIVGNGGDNIPLHMTLYAIKGFEYWKQKLVGIRKTYASCGQDLKSIQDPAHPWSDQEWQTKLIAKCGTEPAPDVAYFDAIDTVLKTTKLFLSNNVGCGPSNVCGDGWRDFTAEKKIYIDPARWDQLSEQNKMGESLLAYDSLVTNSRKAPIDQNLKTEIYKLVFQIDFSMDTFVNFTDEHKIKIVQDGSESYTQQKIVSQMSMAMDCLRLVEKRFPDQLDVKKISLIEDGQTSYFYAGPYPNAVSYLDGGKNNARIRYEYETFHVDGHYSSPIGIRATEKQLSLGSGSNLQECYNAVVSTGLKNPMLELVPPGVLQKDTLKPPMTGTSGASLEFINIAFKALDYVIQDQRKVSDRYQTCLAQNQPTGIQTCQGPSIQADVLDHLAEIFPTITFEETSKRLCTTNSPDCTEADSVVAINLPDARQIFFNQTKWKNLDVQSKIKISLHEVFGIAGIESNDYHVSSFFAPLVQTEGINVDFLADDLRSFLNARKIFPKYISDSYDQIHFQDRATLLMDCLKLVEQRFPDRLDIGSVSLRKKEIFQSGLEITDFELAYLDGSLTPEFSWVSTIGKKALYIDVDTTLQQCYNKVVALGLKN